MNIEPTDKVMPPCGQGIPARVEITDEMVERAAEAMEHEGMNDMLRPAVVRKFAYLAVDAALNGEKP
jgi:hypothetical protein